MSKKINVLYCPCPSTEVAKNLGQQLIETKQAFCCNILDQVTSIFFWKNTVHEESEAVLVVKTETKDPESVILFLKNLHPYEEPVVVSWNAFL